MIFSIHTDQHIKDANGIFGYSYGYHNIVKYFNRFVYKGEQLEVVHNDPAAQVQMFYMEPEWHHPVTGHDFRSKGFKKHFDHQYKINGTYLEATKVWDWWIPTMKTFDEIWVGNKFSAQAIANSGIETPTYVFQLGVDKMWTKKRRGKNSKIRLLHVDSDSPRKRADLVEKAFLTLFDGNPNVELTLKHHGNGNSAGYSVMDLFKEEKTNIRRIFQTFSQEEMVKLYHDHDILVYPSEGEGFGLIPLQALVTGMPVISTGVWCDYENYLNGNVIESTMGKTQHTGYHTGDVILPDFDSLVELMKNTVENIDAQSKLFYDRADKIAQRYDWDRQCNIILCDLINRIGIDMFKPIGKVSRSRYIFFDSNGAYVTNFDIRFSKESPLHKVTEDQYYSLMRNNNFRDPTMEEIIKYGGYNG